MRFLTVLFIGFAFLVPAQKKAAKLLIKGDKKLNKTDTLAAMSCYQKALWEDSTFADSYAKISDIYGRKKIYLIGLIIFFMI